VWHYSTDAATGQYWLRYRLQELWLDSLETCLAVEPTGWEVLLTQKRCTSRQQATLMREVLELAACEASAHRKRPHTQQMGNTMSSAICMQEAGGNGTEVKHESSMCL
jgi:hypothetical protein